ncbi:hypothetical protein E2C01_016759 [Portunus trituberculatus]|uniref:Uncharacterized protein n=1 Tax=Portunus trituberculatus TaxID=210409 RepID=A0A5B7DRI6_PORTR|nr:hypothetical protein [Portunus trituberculatus]
MGFSVSTGVSSVTSPSYTSFTSLIRRPIARRKFSIRTSVFFTSELYTSDPTIGQKGTCQQDAVLDSFSHLVTELLCKGEGDGSLASAWRPCK